MLTQRDQGDDFCRPTRHPTPRLSLSPSVTRRASLGPEGDRLDQKREICPPIHKKGRYDN